MSKLSENNTSRLASLDILRGFDSISSCLSFRPVFAALVRQLNLPFLNDILYQFDHEVWEGFRFWDLVMPLFLFMTGASMPVFTVKVRRYVRQLLARLSEDSEAGVSAVYFRNDCSGKSAWTGQQSYLSLFKYFAVYCCRLFYCGSHSVTFFIQVADRITLLLLFIYWIPMTFLGDFTTGWKLCRTGGQMGFRSFQRWCFLE